MGLVQRAHMTVTRNGVVRTMAKPARRVTDAVCALSKMDAPMLAETARRLREKSPRIADLLADRLEQALYESTNR